MAFKPSGRVQKQHRLHRNVIFKSVRQIFSIIGQIFKFESKYDLLAKLWSHFNRSSTAYVLFQSDNGGWDV